MIADPDDGGMRPTRIDMVVVLPAPLWPSSARESGDGERYCNSDTGDLAFKHVQRQVINSHFPVLRRKEKISAMQNTISRKITEKLLHKPAI